MPLNTHDLQLFHRQGPGAQFVCRQGPAVMKCHRPSVIRHGGACGWQVTLVDCPGHASLIRTILCGARIIDMVLLVVDITKGAPPPLPPQAELPSRLLLARKRWGFETLPGQPLTAALPAMRLL